MQTITISTCTLWVTVLYWFIHTAALLSIMQKKWRIEHLLLRAKCHVWHNIWVKQCNIVKLIFIYSCTSVNSYTTLHGLSGYFLTIITSWIPIRCIEKFLNCIRSKLFTNSTFQNEQLKKYKERESSARTT